MGACAHILIRSLSLSKALTSYSWTKVFYGIHIGIASLLQPSARLHKHPPMVQGSEPAKGSEHQRHQSLADITPLLENVDIFIYTYVV